MLIVVVLTENDAAAGDYYDDDAGADVDADVTTVRDGARSNGNTTDDLSTDHDLAQPEHSEILGLWLGQARPVMAAAATAATATVVVVVVTSSDERAHASAFARHRSTPPSSGRGHTMVAPSKRFPHGFT